MHFVARFFFSFSRKPDDFFCQPTTKSPYFAPPGPAENQSQSSNLVFSSARDAREEEKINQRVVRDLRDFKMTTSDSYEPNHHTSSSRPCCSEAIVTQSSEPVCASIGEMANAPLLTAHTEKKTFPLCARDQQRIRCCFFFFFYLHFPTASKLRLFSPKPKNFAKSIC